MRIEALLTVFLEKILVTNCEIHKKTDLLNITNVNAELCMFPSRNAYIVMSGIAAAISPSDNAIRIVRARA